MNFIPDSFLINNIYLPFYEKPKETIFNSDSQLKIETGANQLKSVISIREDEKDVIPFIDLSMYDSETRGWFWFDSEGFPLRGNFDDDGYLVLSPIYPVSRYYGQLLIIEPNILLLDKSNNRKNLGWYSEVSRIDYSDFEGEKPKVYIGSPMMLRINNQLAKDRTDYYNFNNDMSLTNFRIEGNIEFFYNSQLNKIYTNQDLTGASIELYFLRTNQIVKVKSILASNNGMNSYVTPTVDYYIAKLHGQYLKG